MINIPGVIGVIIFYLVILFVGIWAGRKFKRKGINPDSEELMLAGRNIGIIVGIFTMTATWVGGGYINGTAEIVYSSGLIMCQAPFGYALSLVIGGKFFAKKMRQEGYVTMLDPFQKKFGKRMGGLLFLPALLGEVFWSAAILSALGATISVIIDINNTTAIIVSSAIAVFYTLFGGLYAVAYTDVVQLICIFVGLWICVPFALRNPLVDNPMKYKKHWIGHLEPILIGQYVDAYLLLTFGGIPWQVYFQRVLSAKTAYKAQLLSYVAALGCFIMAVPSVIIGIVGYSTRWNETTYDGPIPIPPENEKLILPLVLQYLTPPVVTFIGLGAVSAAVMSSSDSSILSAASMFARNIYKLLIHQKATDREVIWVMRIAIIGVGVLATVLAISITTIYGLWYLCADLVYVILFPQLVCTVYYPVSNLYGSLSAYFIGLLFRCLGGEPLLHLPIALKYPYYSDKYGQLFPFKTFSMLLSLITLLGVSFITEYIFVNNYLPPKFDFLECIVNIPEDVIQVKEPQEGEMIALNSPYRKYLKNDDEEKGEDNPVFDDKDDVKYNDVKLSNQTSIFMRRTSSNSMANGIKKESI
ncbi:unnamed protein product [Gordionus sp. m RMFG-2023]|uniref:high-affinity choline transporter 1-like n=1 Tax=Gordionus sp. m RMFG-2023 TaxID=3053472 RepID=UPI0030DEFC91